MMATAERCERCGGRLLVYPTDRYGSDIACIACGATPATERERLRAADALLAANGRGPDVRQRHRAPTYNGVPL